MFARSAVSNVGDAAIVRWLASKAASPKTGSDPTAREKKGIVLQQNSTFKDVREGAIAKLDTFASTSSLAGDLRNDSLLCRDHQRAVSYRGLVRSVGVLLLTPWVLLIIGHRLPPRQGHPSRRLRLSYGRREIQRRHSLLPLFSRTNDAGTL